MRIDVDNMLSLPASSLPWFCSSSRIIAYDYRQPAIIAYKSRSITIRLGITCPGDDLVPEPAEARGGVRPERAGPRRGEARREGPALHRQTV
jgi:hypothetical protein